MGISSFAKTREGAGYLKALFSANVLIEGLGRTCIFNARKHFSNFPHKIFTIILRDIIGLEKFTLSFSQS